MACAFAVGIGVAIWNQFPAHPESDGHDFSSPLQSQISADPSPQTIGQIISSLPQEPARTMRTVPSPQIFDFRVRRQADAVSSAPTPLIAARSGANGANTQYEESVALARSIVPPEISGGGPGLPTGRRPRIAIVIDDVGPDYQGARQSIALPAPVTLAFLPYAERLEQLTSLARAAGHELLVHLPTEPGDMAHNNPGPGALLVSQSPQEQLAALSTALESFSGYVGVNNHMGSRFTADWAGMHLLLAELARRDLLFLDSRTTSQTVGPELASRLGLRFVGRDVFLDNELDEGRILAQLQQAERVARHRGQAVAIGHPHDVTLRVIRGWIPAARRAGFELVPISRLAVKPGPARVAAAGE